MLINIYSAKFKHFETNQSASYECLTSMTQKDQWTNCEFRTVITCLIDTIKFLWLHESSTNLMHYNFCSNTWKFWPFKFQKTTCHSFRCRTRSRIVRKSPKSQWTFVFRRGWVSSRFDRSLAINRFGCLFCSFPLLPVYSPWLLPPKLISNVYFGAALN